MALSTRELLVILRARDEMSQVLERNSRAFATVGAAADNVNAKLLGAGLALTGVGNSLATAGKAVVGFGIDSVFAGVDFEELNARTKTQALNFDITVDELGDFVKDIAAIYPVAIEEIQQGQRDLFSTVEATPDEIQNLLSAAALSGVVAGGGTDIFADLQGALVNAFQLSPSEGQNIADTIFRSAEFGRIEAPEFASAFEDVIAPATALNQTFEDSAAVMAVLTKTGLGVGKSSISTARGFDTIRKEARNLEAAGIDVIDEFGNFQDIGTIIDDLAKSSEGLTGVALDEWLNEVFGGPVELRARRGLISLIENNDLLQQSLENSNKTFEDAGGIQDAYAVVSDTNRHAIDELKNAFALLRLEVADALMPVLEQLIDWASRLIDWWNSLDEETRTLIIQMGALAGIIALVFGTVVAFVGTIMTAVAVLGFLGVSLGFILAVSAAVIIIFGLLVAGAILLWQNWDTVKEKAQQLWDKLQQFWAWLSETFGPGWDQIKEAALEAWREIEPEITETIDVIKERIENFLADVEAFWEAHGEEITATLKVIWEIISTIIAAAIRIIGKIIEIGLNIIQGDWDDVWQNVKDILQIAWDAAVDIVEIGSQAIVDLLAALPGEAQAALSPFPPLMLAMGMAAIQGLWTGMKAIWNFAKAWLDARETNVKSAFRGAGRWLYSIGQAILQGLINGLASRLGRLASIASKIARTVRNIVKLGLGIRSPSTVFAEIGENVMAGLDKGLVSGFRNVQSTVGGLTTATNLQPTVSVGSLGTQGSMNQMALVDALKEALSDGSAGLNVEGDLVLGSADDIDELDWWARTQNAGV